MSNKTCRANKSFMALFALTFMTGTVLAAPVTTQHMTIPSTAQAVLNSNITSNDSNIGSISNRVKSFTNSRQYIFSDVPSDYWAYQSISTMTQEKMISGYSDNTFKPDSPLTREEAAALFNKMIGDSPTVMLASTFSDITSDRWSALAIQSVAQKNIISGYGDSTYRPEKYMSRQEFAVVADNYLHYLGYNTEDPTVLDEYQYADQKFVAPWAQDAVRELAYLGFLAYNPHNIFNGEKYITRAEATEIAFRMTHTQASIDFLDAVHRQTIENKAVTLINNTFQYEEDDLLDFRNHGAMFWNNDKLYITVKDSSRLKQLGSALAMSGDKELLTNSEVRSGKYSQADFDELQTETTYYYNKLQPTGSVLALTPDIDASSLTLTVDKLDESSQKAFNKYFGKKATIEQKSPNDINWSKPVRLNLVQILKRTQQ